VLKCVALTAEAHDVVSQCFFLSGERGHARDPLTFLIGEGRAVFCRVALDLSVQRAKLLAPLSEARLEGLDLTAEFSQGPLTVLAANEVVLFGHSFAFRDRTGGVTARRFDLGLDLEAPRGEHVFDPPALGVQPIDLGDDVLDSLLCGRGLSTGREDGFDDRDRGLERLQSSF